MSTFDGVIREFPRVRVDFLRGILEDPPLATFLSHIHSDHLAGLDSYKGRPVYCSAATRAMLLKLQRRSSRINFHRGLLEIEDITYKHQNRRLKPLPLETPTIIELEPGHTIRVTLFDANHCPGAVMFLFEGNGKAVLYTGDIRSEPWHVNALARSPCMIEYSSGIKTLDTVYLDTSFTEDVIFQSKAEGLRELIEKVSKYPKDTNFYFSAWTYGYEDVWIALAKALDTRIHVDDYKLNVYKALHMKLEEDQHVHLSRESPALTGFNCGNSFQPGILTRSETVRLHSCEKGTRCSTMATGGVVFITPIVAHLSSTSDMAEVGIGGGADDLGQKDELILTPEDARILLRSVSESKNLPEDAKDSLPKFLLSAASAQRPITLSLPSENDDYANEATGLHRALKSLTNASGKGRGREDAGSLPNRIKFPYSRHSSYRELCHLLEVLKPNDVWPCTVDHARWLRQGITIETLFGGYCAGNQFQHDDFMTQLAVGMAAGDSQQHQSQTSVESAADDTRQPLAVHKPAISGHGDPPSDRDSNGKSQHFIDLLCDSDDFRAPEIHRRSSGQCKRTHEGMAQHGTQEGEGQPGESAAEDDTSHLVDSQESSLSARRLETRRHNFNSMIGALPAHYEWDGLLSTTNNHTQPESELGES